MIVRDATVRVGVLRLFFFILVSIAAHVLLLMYLALGRSDASVGFGAPGNFLRVALEAKIFPTSVRTVLLSSQDPHKDSRDNQVPQTKKRGKARVVPPGGWRGFPVVDSEPQLESEVAFKEIDPRISGKMILYFMINERGVVDQVDSLYSDFPPETQANLMEAFREAQFRPAIQNGEPVRSTLLLRVDID